MANILASLGYFPAGGLQIIFSIIGLFNQDIFIKFNSLQALFYWIIISIFIYPLSLFLTSSIGQTKIGLFVLITYIGLFGFIIPLVLLIKAIKSNFFKIPLIGTLSEKITKYSSLGQAQVV